ncbi:hypothetical protein KAR91_41295 [Candidatus Pacearchaeota archaeon]|nr:hypothetical protein [Candidatus Pacearchaeota archaeon]
MNQELPYAEFDDEGKVVCQICGKSYQVISPRHLAIHKLLYADYTKRYPDAPLASDQFTVKSKYGKHTGLFKEEEVVVDEEIFVDEEPELEEIELEEALDKVVNEIRDHVQVGKMMVLDHLRLHFANIEKDYVITEISPMSKKLLFQFITDFTDPVLKIVFDFPDTFWHNIDANVDPLKKEKLNQHGWKIVTCKSKSPTTQQLNAMLDNM